MNYKPVVAGNQSNGSASKARMKTVPDKDYILLPLWTQEPLLSFSSKDSPGDGFKPSREEEKKDAEDPGNKDNKVLSIEEPRINQERDVNVNNTNNINTVSLAANATSTKDNVVDENIVYRCADDPNMPNWNRLSIQMMMKMLDHPVEQNFSDIHLAPQTRRMTKNVTNYETKKVIQALIDLSWIEAMQDELLQFKLQQVWTLVDLLYGKRAIGTKWIYINNKYERGIMVRNKARLVAQGYTKEEGIDYDEVFALVARIEAIRLFLAYASFKDFVVYHLHVKSASAYGKIEEEALYGLHQTPRAWYETLSTYLLDNGFHKGQIDKTLFIKRVKGDILLVQVYVDDIIFGSTRKEMYTDKYTMETSKPLMKHENAKDIDVHLYRSMIGSLIIFRYLKDQPKLRLWYPKDSPFNLETYADSDYAGASLDGKSTTGGCQFLGSRLISWQCKKQPIVANSTTEAEQGKDFSRRVILLFETMLIQHQEEVVEGSDETVHEKKGDIVERAATTTASLDAEQHSEDAEIQGRYGHDTKINTASTSITTTSINVTTAEPVTTVSAPITTAGVFVSTVEPKPEMKMYMKIFSGDEVAIDAITLATKPPIIVDWKIIKEGKISSYHIISVDGSSKMYSSMIQMLQNIDREDLVTLWKLVKAKYGNTRPEEAYERVLWGDLKVMFESNIKSEV
nr:hypothetical protein [Tanacetum cinerariifolium]